MSKELEALERMTEHLDLDDEYFYKQEKVDEEIIKQSLIKSQEQEKILKVIKEKGVDVGYLKTCKSLEEYNSNCWDDEEDFNKKLTQEEFNLLKEVLEMAITITNAKSLCIIRTEKDLYKDYNINSYDDLEKALKKAKALDILNKSLGFVRYGKSKEIKVYDLGVDNNEIFLKQEGGCLYSTTLDDEIFNLLNEVLK